MLRRLGRLEDAEKVFRDALNNTPNNSFRNNFANLLIDQQIEEAETIFKADLKKIPITKMQSNLNRLAFQRNLAASPPKQIPTTLQLK